MPAVYVREYGASIQKRGERIAVVKGGNTLLEFPVANLDSLAVIGNVQLTMPVLHMLLEKGIDVSYFSAGGTYLGHTCTNSARNVFLRFAQYHLYENQNMRLKYARMIVQNKIQNQIQMIRTHHWEGLEYDWKQDVEQMERYAKRLEEQETINGLMGIEGISSNIYFSVFGRMFHCDFEFHGRNRRPPKDPINVLISLGYTLLTREICSVLEAESFETYLGFLHGIRYGRKSLALDLIEEFRQPIVDRLVVTLCNKRIINREHFSIENGAVTLSEEGFKIFCKEYEKMMNGTGLIRKTAFRNVVRKQASILKKSILDELEYCPFSWKNEEEKIVHNKL